MATLRRSKEERGVSLVEFTIVLPVLVFLLCLTVDFSMFINEYFGVTHLAREGARTAAWVAAVNSTGKTTVRDRIVNKLDAAGYSKASLSISISEIDVGCDQPNGEPPRVRVTIKHNYRPLLLRIPQLLPISYKYQGNSASLSYSTEHWGPYLYSNCS